MIIWPEPDEVVTVSNEDIPEQTEMFALVYVPYSELLTWWELMDAAVRANRDAADELEWSIGNADSSDDRQQRTAAHSGVAVW